MLSLLIAAVLAAPTDVGLGARFRPLPAGANVAPGELAGMVVDVVYVEGAAARAGLRRGDVLLSLDGDAVPFPHVLGQVLQERSVGDEVTLAVGRDGARLERTVRLGRLSEELAAGCDKADAPSCGGLAELHLRGAGVEPDPYRAARLFQQACDAGDAASCTSVGFMHLRMTSKPVHPGAAIALYTKGCDGGDPRACALLGQAYEVGLAMPADPERGLRLYHKACDGGAGEGCSALAASAKEAALRIDLYRQACDLWDWQGCFVFAGLLEEDGASFAAALAAYRRACDAGHPTACLRAAQRQQQGRGTAVDEPRAAALLQRVCEQWGFLPACEPLADVYAGGRGLPRDPGRAAALLTRGCEELGMFTSCRRLAALHRTGDGVPQDVRRAAELLERACDGGDGEACAALAEMRDADQEPARAVELRRKACALGVTRVCEPSPPAGSEN